MTEKLVRREGFGDVIADGVKIAAERSARAPSDTPCTSAARRSPLTIRAAAGASPSATAPTPHPDATTRAAGSTRRDSNRARSIAMQRAGRGLYHKISTNYMHAASALGLCQFVIGSYPHPDQLVEALQADHRLGGHHHRRTPADGRAHHQRPPGLQSCARVWKDPSSTPTGCGACRPRRSVPAPASPSRTRRSTTSICELMDWDTSTGMPSKAKLLELGLDDIAEVLWP